MEFLNSASLCFNDSGILKFPRVRVGKATDFGIVGVNLVKEDQTFRLSDRTAAKRSGNLRVRALSANEVETFRFVDQTCRFRSDIGVSPDGSGEKQTNLGIFADHGANIRGTPRLWPPIPRSNDLLRKSDAMLRWFASSCWERCDPRSGRWFWSKRHLKTRICRGARSASCRWTVTDESAVRRRRHL